MPAENITVVAQLIEDVVSECVEIVFDAKDMTKEQVKEFVKRYTDEKFEIKEFGVDGETGETTIIIRFSNSEKAKDFVRNVNGGSAQNVIKRVKASFFCWIGLFHTLFFNTLSN